MKIKTLNVEKFEWDTILQSSVIRLEVNEAIYEIGENGDNSIYVSATNRIIVLPRTRNSVAIAQTPSGYKSG